MTADAVKDATGRGDIVLDPLGSAVSTLIAEHKTGRVANLGQLGPIYCDRIIAHYEAFAKDEAQLIACWSEQAMPYRMVAE